MKIPILLWVLVASLIAITSFDYAFAENADLWATTDKTAYQIGDSVIFSGQVPDYPFGETVTYVMDDPEGYVSSLGQIIPNSDGSFLHTFESDLDLWKLDGKYNITYYYGSDLSTNSKLTYYYALSPVYDGNTISPVMDSDGSGCGTSSSGCYYPLIMIVNIGEDITFHNSDRTAHTFTSGTAADGDDGKFNSELLSPGESFVYYPDTPGEIPYFCMFHPWMDGMIIVESNVPVEPSFLDLPPIFVSTDKLSYKGKEHVRIAGMVIDTTTSTVVSLTISSSNGNVVYDDVASVIGRAFDRMVVPEALWEEGTYVVTARYDSRDISATSSFDYEGYDPILTNNEIYNSQSITVTTNKSTYENGDKIFATGEISEYDSSAGYVISYNIKAPDNAFITISQISPDSDGTFSISHGTGGSLWKLSGDYSFEVKYYDGVSSHVKFEYQSDDYLSPVPEPTPELESEPTPELESEPTPELESEPTPNSEPEEIEVLEIVESESSALIETDSIDTENLTNQVQNEIKTVSKQLDSQTQNKIQTLDSKISREESQRDEYLKQYDYYNGKTLSVTDEKKFNQVIVKLDSLNEKIDSLIDEKDTIISEAEDVSESIEDKVQPTQSINQEVQPTQSINQEVQPTQSIKQVQPEKEQSCFLFWCW